MVSQSCGVMNIQHQSSPCTTRVVTWSSVVDFRYWSRGLRSGDVKRRLINDTKLSIDRCLFQPRVCFFFVMFRKRMALCSDRVSGAAHRRTDRRLHAFLKHERMSVAMNLATVRHHLFKKPDMMYTTTQTELCIAPRTYCDLRDTGASQRVHGTSSSADLCWFSQGSTTWHPNLTHTTPAGPPLAVLSIRSSNNMFR